MSFTLPVYLDNNASTPMDPRVLEAMLPYFTEKPGNAASLHHAPGRAAAAAVDHARAQVARLIHAEPEEIVFTSGGTESANLALKGVFERFGKQGHIITCRTEHKAVLDSCRHIEQLGGQISYLPVLPDGRMDIEMLKAAIRPETVMIAVMYANNETGVIHDIPAIGSIARQHGLLFFSDAVQSAGKIPVDVRADGISLLALSGHKIYGPKGIGVLYVQRRDPRVSLTAQMDGGGHERGRRSGTLNVPGIVGLGKAAELCRMEMAAESLHCARLRNKLEQALLSLEETYVNGNTSERLPHVSNISFRYVAGRELMTGFSPSVALSSGSACTAALPEASHVLKAQGLGEELAKSSFRFSLGRFTTEAQIDYAIQAITDTVIRARAQSPYWEMFREGQDIDPAAWAHQ